MEKYGLKADDAILYEDKHQGLEKDMLAQYSVNYVAGGSVQNTMRITEWCLGFKVIRNHHFLFFIDQLSIND